MSRPHQILADNMRRLRSQRGWSQERLAAECGLHRTYIGAVERCERNPSVTSIERIAAAFGVEAWLLLRPSSNAHDDSAAATAARSDSKSDPPTS